MNYAVDVENLSVDYESHLVLDNITWRVETGSLAAVIGPNGGGKSTLLKSLLSLVPIAAGSVRIFGEEPKKARVQVAYLPQREEVDWSFPISCLDVVLQGRLARLRWCSIQSAATIWSKHVCRKWVWGVRVPTHRQPVRWTTSGCSSPGSAQEAKLIIGRTRGA